MMKIKFMGLVGVLLVVGVLVFGMVGTAFANPTSWDLDGSRGAGTEANPYHMNHQSAGVTENDSIYINAGDTVYIRSNAPNATDTVFSDMGSPDWRLYVYSTGTSVAYLTATIGTWTSGGGFNVDGYTSGGLTDISYTWDDASDTGYLNFDQIGDKTISGGVYLAVRVTADAGEDVEIITEDFGSNSYLWYNGIENPEWPVPEIITITTISLAVLALGGFVWYRRRQPEQVVA